MLNTMKYSLEQRKLSLLVPVPVVFCLLLVFHGLGGGKGKATGADSTAVAQGINKMLPPVKSDTNSKAPDKMQLYAMAAADSVRLREKQKEDPYAAGHSVAADSAGRNVIHTAITQRQLTADATADKVLEKVSRLKQELGTSARNGGGIPITGMGQAPSASSGMERQPGPDRLSVLPAGLEVNKKIARDPEMERIDAMLDKLIRIQHPDIPLQDTGKAAAPARTFVLESPGEAEDVGSIQRENGALEEETTGFIEISEEEKPDTVGHARGLALEAVVEGDQTVVNGSTVALRLAGAGVLDGLAVPSDQLLYGQASISGERLIVHISSLRVGDMVLPVSIQVYDLDGLVGIRVPGAITREVSKESASEAMSGLGLASMDPSLTGQAANAGLQLAKSLTSRKIRTVRVQLPAGYKVLLKNIK